MTGTRLGCNLKHGGARVSGKTTEYKIWCAMRERCNRVQSTEFKRYGGRGIRVCERWNDFANFLADMGPRPSRRHSLDRYPNNDGHYEPDNCRWATSAEQQRNKGISVRLTLNGQTHHVIEWANILNISLNTLRMRLRWSRDPARVLRPLEQQYSRRSR